VRSTVVCAHVLHPEQPIVHCGDRCLELDRQIAQLAEDGKAFRAEKVERLLEKKLIEGSCELSCCNYLGCHTPDKWFESTKRPHWRGVVCMLGGGVVCTFEGTLYTHSMGHRAHV
jgi:hypothetical protein